MGDAFSVPFILSWQECIYQVLKLDAKPRVFKSDDTLLRIFLNGFKISDIHILTSPMIYY